MDGKRAEEVNFPSYPPSALSCFRGGKRGGGGIFFLFFRNSGCTIPQPNVVAIQALLECLEVKERQRERVREKTRLAAIMHCKTNISCGNKARRHVCNGCVSIAFCSPQPSAALIFPSLFRANATRRTAHRRYRHCYPFPITL